jgi:meso-butanediol dehydrogenase/(S,S)-butanediol dehydrogenase/diacetyl reductase
MGKELKDKVIVLTCGADGIGRECALAYGREGATVAILDRNLDTAQHSASEIGGSSIALGADVSDGEAVRGAIGVVLKQF